MCQPHGCQLCVGTTTLLPQVIYLLFFLFSFSLLPLLLSFFFSLLTQGLHVAQGDPEFAMWLQVLLPFTSPEFWDYSHVWGHQGLLFLPFNLKTLHWVWLEYTLKSAQVLLMTAITFSLSCRQWLKQVSTRLNPSGACGEKSFLEFSSF